MTDFGPNGKDVYIRTYSRIKDDGQRETWPETVRRVVDGNLSLVDEKFIANGERDVLVDLMEKFAIIPAGRHLWLSGVQGKQFINNCWVAGWDAYPTSHFTFTFDQLMQGGGVGSNYSNVNYNLPGEVNLHLVVDSDHADLEDLRPYLSTEYVSDSSHALPVEDSREGWVSILAKLFTMWTSGGGTLVLDLSRIRRSGTKIKTFGGTSAGPVPLAKLLTKVNDILWDFEGAIIGRSAMMIDHAIAECVVSGNVRRSARMSIMHWLDPEIEWFLGCKTDWADMWSTNVSVEIDNEFLEALNDPENALHPVAEMVFNAVTEGMMKNGEPGFWNSDLSNEGEPNKVIATNPCGEIVLPEWGVCNLGHVNLDWFAEMPVESILTAHALMARFLVRATFADIPNEEARKVQDRDRRIGVGHFGLHGFLAKSGIRYSEAGQNQDLAALLQKAKEAARESARRYASQLRIPEPIKVTTVAPTGTIAKMPGRSEGIHPIFSPYFIRRIRFSTVDPHQMAQLEDYELQGFKSEKDLYSENTWVVEFPSKEPLVDELEEMGIDPSILESAYDLSLADQFAVQALYQKFYADNAVSYTVNYDPAEVDLVDLQDSLRGFLPFLKGATVFPVVSRPQSPYEPITKEEYEAAAAKITSDGVDEECSSGACPIK